MPKYFNINSVPCKEEQKLGSNMYYLKNIDQDFYTLVARGR
jgi:hypothetical protein